MSKLPRPFDRWTTYPGHGGIDYPQARGTLVRASGPGFIDWSGYYNARGGYAKFITYDNGQRHGYYHFDREAGGRVGDRVDYGTGFAYVGSLGQNSTGPHLHHEVWNGHTSIIKPPAYWDYVDASRYVGDGTPSGGGGTPLPTPILEETEDDMLYLRVALDSDKTVRPFFTLLNTNTNVYFPPQYSNAPAGWAAFGQYKKVTPAGFDDLLSAVWTVTGNVPFQGTEREVSL